MAVAPDAASESHTGTTGSTNQASFSWTHTPVGTPRGVLVFAFYLGSGDLISAVTYGGVAMQHPNGAFAQDTATEIGSCKAFFLGEGIPTGAQTVVVTRPNNANIAYAICVTATANGNTAIASDIKLLQENVAAAEQNIDDGSPGTASLRVAGAYTGAAAPLPPGANSTALHDIDFGANGCSAVRETTPGQGSRPVGFSGAADDLAAVHLAIKEAGATTHQAAAALSGAGTVAPGASVTYGGTAALSGSGAIAPTARLTLGGSSALSGTGAVAAVGEKALFGQAALTGAGSVSPGAAVTYSAASAIAGAGSLTPLGQAVYSANAALAGAGQLAGAPTMNLAGVIVLPGVVVLVAAADVVAPAIQGEAAVSGAGAVVAAAVMTASGAAALSGVASLAAAATVSGAGGASVTRDTILQMGAGDDKRSG